MIIIGNGLIIAKVGDMHIHSHRHFKFWDKWTDLGHFYTIPSQT